MKKMTFLIIGALSFSAVHAVTYIVQKGDTLSAILYEKNFKPIYGKSGSLAKTLLLNPKVDRVGHYIYPGQKILLVDEEVQNAIPLALVEEKNEREKEVVPVSKNDSRSMASTFDQSFFWSVSPTVSWKSLSSKDSNLLQNSKVTALSDMNYGASFTYGMSFSESVDIYSKIALEVTRFSSESDLRLIKKNYLASAFSFGLAYNKNWQFEAMMNDEFFLTSPSAKTVDIKKVSLPEFKAGYRNDLYQFQEASLLYNLAAKVILPRDAQGIDAELGYGGSAGIEAKLRNQSFHIGFEYTTLKASGNSTDLENIFWKYSWETP